MVPHNKKEKTGIMQDLNPNIKPPKHGGTQSYCIMFNESVITDHKNMSYTTFGQ